MTEYNYHIYIKNKCVYHSLPEEEFKNIWKSLDHLCSIYGSTKKEDVTYEKVSVTLLDETLNALT